MNTGIGKFKRPLSNTIFTTTTDESFFQNSHSRFVKFYIGSNTILQIFHLLNALSQPPPSPRKAVEESVGDKMTRGTRDRGSELKRQACTLSWRERGGQQRRQSRESRKVAESRGPSGRDPAGMQRRLELIDRGTRANLSASWRRV